MKPQAVCKIVTRDELEQALVTGEFEGSPLDLADGFLHFSTEGQLAGTLSAHFAASTELWLMRVNVEAVGESLRWESSRGGDVFPHLYSSLAMEQVESVQPIRLNHPKAVHPDSVSRRILYLHGWRSVVGGVKPSALMQAGHQLIEPELDDDDFDFALSTAQEAFDRHQPELVVGSSRGGALAVNLRLPTNVPRIVLCPAWKKWGAAKQVPVNTLILHSPDDEVIPFEDSVELVENSAFSDSHLIVVGSDHRLATPDAIDSLRQCVLEFPDRAFPPWQ